MVFAHDTERSLQAAVTLVNSAEPPDTLRSVAELDAFFSRFAYTGRHDRDDAELDAVRRLRPRLRTLLTAERDATVEIVLDLSRNRSKIFCDTACSNRAAVAPYRARKR